ncbi:hypothetical protein [Kitasatospora sp. NPDC058190]|uniref:hypothetical protein n=1 Tax=Kitasatospora sp. NPDC058190 TaxID=3346371 RepID=UPI0036DAF958
MAEHLQVPVHAGCLYLLPDKTVDGVAAYHEDIAGLVKTLKRDGVAIDFAVPKDARGYLSEYSADAILATIGVAVLTNLSTEVAKAVAKNIATTARARIRAALRRSDPAVDVEAALVTVKIAELEIGQPGVILRGVEITAHADQIERLAGEALLRPVSPIQYPEGSAAPQPLPGAEAE